MNKSKKADLILGKIDLSIEQKLFLLSQLYKEELSSQFPQLHYVLAGWKDSNLNKLWCSKVIDVLEQIKEEKLNNGNS